jgi:polyhydroxyalkanoate synthesis regulator phasin
MQLAAGLLESASERAKDSAADLINQGMEAGTKGPETVSAQVQGIAEDLIEQGRTNRELMIGLVRTEVERTVGKMGFVREEELAAVRKHVERLERQLNQRGDQASAAANLAVTTATSAVPAATKAAAMATDTAVKASRAAAGTARTAARTAAGATKTTQRPPSPPANPRPDTAPPTAKKAPVKKAPAKKAPVKRAPKKPAAAKKPAKES